MSLTHFVIEARKNTPSLTKTVLEAVETGETSKADLNKEMAEISKTTKTLEIKEIEKPTWKSCQYMKGVGDKEMCTQYMSLCAKEKCQQKFMDAKFFDFKKHLKQRKPIK